MNRIVKGIGWWLEIHRFIWILICAVLALSIIIGTGIKWQWWTWINNNSGPLIIAVNIVTLVVGILIIIGIGVALYRWSGRPRFIVGVPPFQAEKIPWEKIGHTSIRDQFRHRKGCFAVYLGEKRKFSKRDEGKLFDKPLRCRILQPSPGNYCTLPIVAENCGRRAARDYILEIIFHESRVHVIDVTKESLDLSVFNCNRIDLVQNPRLKQCIAPKGIMDAYDNYMGKYGDLLFFIGTLESGAYEMVLLKIKVEPEVERFVIGYSLDCSDGWVSRETFFQGFKVEGKNSVTTASEAA